MSELGDREMIRHLKREGIELKHEIDRLKTKNANLEHEINDVSTESLMAGYQQCLDELSGVVNGVMEITRAQGPVAGLEHILSELERKDVSIKVPAGMPYDWLSRWTKVDIA